MSKILLTEGAAAETPGTGKQAIYSKTDGKLYKKDDAGVEVLVSEDGESLTVYDDSAAIAIETTDALLTKATAGAYTLAAPTVAQDGTRLRLIAGTAAAHVITATGLLEDGVSGGAKDTATMAAFIGATITLLAVNEKWIVLNLNAVVVA